MTIFRKQLCNIAFLAISVLIAGLGLGSPVAAQETATSEGRAFLVTPLSFVKQTDLDFGVIIPSNRNGNVTMDSTGAVTTNNGIVHVEGTQEPALFWGYGQLNQTVLINITANTYTLTREGGSETMQLNRVTIGSAPPIRLQTNPRRFRIVNPDGFFSFTIAGRLRVNADQVPGTYRGEIAVQLEYE